jgi:hypothetical protein
MIEADCYLTRELEMLGLIFAYWDVRGVVEQDVGRLKNGVGEETKFQSVFIRCRFERRGIVG